MSVALDFRQELLAKISLLAEFPEFGRIGRIAGTREFIAHKNDIFVYTIDQQTKHITIKRVKHAAQLLP